MKTILVTGGTGTFGNAFTEYVLENRIAERVVILSRDEKKQQKMRSRLNGHRLRFLLGNVRDRDRLLTAFDGIDAVIHAAALKQVDRSALDIVEFKRTNVDGTENVIMACHARGVKKCVVLSSDKACASSTPYGATKSLAEWLAIAGNVYGPARIAVVRYGNVLGSRGSVLETWREQTKDGHNITITDRRMTRFWLTIDDAVKLALLALERTGGGEIFIPKNVDRSSVVDLARKYFPHAYITQTGKRSYEKCHEMLVAPEEIDRLHDCGDVYVLAPKHVRWQPGPWGVDFPLVEEGFEYASNSG